MGVSIFSLRKKKIIDTNFFFKYVQQEKSILLFVCLFVDVIFKMESRKKIGKKNNKNHT